MKLKAGHVKKSNRCGNNLVQMSGNLQWHLVHGGRGCNLCQNINACLWSATITVDHHHHLSDKIFLWEHMLHSFPEHLIVFKNSSSFFQQEPGTIVSLFIICNLTFKYSFFQKELPNLWSFHNFLFQNFVHEKSFIAST